MILCCFCQVEVSPLENATSVVENKNQELRTLISQYQHKQLHGNINLLSMTLNGVIDAAVNGGIARYQEVFLPFIPNLLDYCLFEDYYRLGQNNRSNKRASFFLPSGFL